MTHNLTPLKLIKNFSVIDAYQFYDQVTKDTIDDLKQNDVYIDHHALILTHIDEILAVDSRKKQEFIKLFVDKLSEDVIESLLEVFKINPNGDNRYHALYNFFSINTIELNKLLGFESSVEDLALSFNLNEIERITPHYPLRQYQIQCCEKIWQLIDAGKQRMLLHLPTGAGKTRTAINFICEYLRKNPRNIVIWLADTIELCDQARNEFNKAWRTLGNKPISSLAFYGSSNLSLSGIDEGFIVAGLQKFRSETESEHDFVLNTIQQFNKNIGLIVFDEAHKALASTYKELILNIINGAEEKCILLGLSATPGRKVYHNDDDSIENQKLSELFHNNKIAPHIPGYVSIIEYLISEGYLADYKILPINYEGNSHSIANFIEHNLDDKEVVKYLAKSDERNKSIVEAIIKEVSAPHPESELKPDLINQSIVFALNIEHAKRLEILLNNAGIKSKVILGETNSFQRSVAIQRYKNKEIKVLINYGVLTAGFDAPNTNSVFIVRPTSSLIEYLQMAGRAMRGPASGGSKSCRIYTVNDNSEQFNNLYNAFKYWDTSWNE